MTAGYDGIIRIFDLKKPICLSQYVGHRSIVTAVVFAKNDSHIISVSFDRTIKIWNSQSANCEKTLTGHEDSITSCDISPDFRILSTASLDKTVRIWDLVTNQCTAVLQKHTRWVKVTKFSLDSKFMFSAGLEKFIYIWDVRSFVGGRTNIAPARHIEAHDDYILDLAVGKARPNFLLSSSRDQTIKLWDHDTGKCIYVVNTTPSWACTIAFSPDSEVWASGSFDNNILICKTDTGERLRQIRVLNGGILKVAFPEQQSYILVGTSEGYVQQISL